MPGITRNRAERFEDLEVWQKAHICVLDVYKMAKGFPAEEKFGLIPQMRRAAVSIAANIVEGFKKRGQRDKAHFYNVAQGSLEELRYYLILSKDLGYIEDNGAVLSSIDEVARMPHRLLAVIKAG